MIQPPNIFVVHNWIFLHIPYSLCSMGIVFSPDWWHLLNCIHECIMQPQSNEQIRKNKTEYDLRFERNLRIFRFIWYNSREPPEFPLRIRNKRNSNEKKRESKWEYEAIIDSDGWRVTCMWAYGIICAQWHQQNFHYFILSHNVTKETQNHIHNRSGEWIKDIPNLSEWRTWMTAKNLRRDNIDRQHCFGLKRILFDLSVGKITEFFDILSQTQTHTKPSDRTDRT